jgi:hypothetical protein
LNHIHTLSQDCYPAGIPNTDAELIKGAIHGGSNHHFNASYQHSDTNIRCTKLHDEELPPFAELESHLLNIDDSCGLTPPFKTSATTINMQFLQPNSLQINLMKSSVQEHNHLHPTAATGHHTALTFDRTIRPLLNQDKTIIMIADIQHNKLPLLTTKLQHTTAFQTNFIQQYKPMASSKQCTGCKTKSQHIQHSKYCMQQLWKTFPPCLLMHSNPNCQPQSSNNN